LQFLVDGPAQGVTCAAMAGKRRFRQPQPASGWQMYSGRRMSVPALHAQRGNR